MSEVTKWRLWKTSKMRRVLEDEMDNDDWKEEVK
jgi:hypothetical protein